MTPTERLLKTWEEVKQTMKELQVMITWSKAIQRMTKRSREKK